MIYSWKNREKNHIFIELKAVSSAGRVRRHNPNGVNSKSRVASSECIRFSHRERRAVAAGDVLGERRLVETETSANKRRGEEVRDGKARETSSRDTAVHVGQDLSGILQLRQQQAAERASAGGVV